MTRKMIYSVPKVLMPITVHPDFREFFRSHFPGQASSMIETLVSDALGIQLEEKTAPAPIPAPKPYGKKGRPAWDNEHRVVLSISVHAETARFLRQNTGRAGMLVDQAMGEVFKINNAPRSTTNDGKKRLLSPVVAARLERLGLPMPYGAVLVKPTTPPPPPAPVVTPAPEPVAAPAPKPEVDTPNWQEIVRKFDAEVLRGESDDDDFT